MGHPTVRTVPHTANFHCPVFIHARRTLQKKDKVSLPHLF